MSTQAVENQTAHVTELKAERTRSYEFTLKIFQSHGFATIEWTLDPNYAIGSEDFIHLYEGTRDTGQKMRVVGHSNQWQTSHPFGSDLKAVYKAWNYETGKAGPRDLVVTPNT